MFLIVILSFSQLFSELSRTEPQGRGDRPTSETGEREGHTDLNINCSEININGSESRS